MVFLVFFGFPVFFFGFWWLWGYVGEGPEVGEQELEEEEEEEEKEEEVEEKEAEEEVEE